VTAALTSGGTGDRRTDRGEPMAAERGKGSKTVRKANAKAAKEGKKGAKAKKSKKK